MISETKLSVLKKEGYKTEPAFGMLLGLDNPYVQLIELEELADDGLLSFIGG